jgi:excinuclease UvrABC nuclease subunit
MTTDIDPRVIRRIADMAAVYRMFDRSGRLLYVGKTSHSGRFDAHAVKRFFPLVTTISLEWHDTEAASLVAESRAIAAERPRYNIAGKRPPRPARPARRPKPAVIKPAVEIGSRATLREAVAAGLFTTVGAARRRSHRDPLFPRPVGGDRAHGYIYDSQELREYMATKEKR